MNRAYRTPVVVFSALALLAGCGDSLLGDSDDELIRDSVGDGGYAGVTTMWDADDVGAALEISALGVRSFGRNYKSADTNYDISRTNSSAEAEVRRSGVGEFVVQRMDNSSFTRPISNDAGGRQLELARSESGGWAVEQLTVFSGQSADGETDIEWARVSWGDNEVLFDDLDQMYATDVLSFLPGQEVVVTVRANHPNVIGVIHQLEGDVRPASSKLLAQSDNDEYEFSNVYMAPQESGRYFTYVDLFDEAVLDEDSLAPDPYSAAAWGMPYVVQR